MAGVVFVTRLKENAAFDVVEECQIPENRNIPADQLIRLTGAHTQADYPELLRRVLVWDAENEREIVLLTNLLKLGAAARVRQYAYEACRRQQNVFGPAFFDAPP